MPQKKGSEDPRSKRFYEMIGVIKDLQQEKLEVFYMGENVASMDSSDQRIFTGFVGTEPYVADAGDISQVRRKRFYWANWRIPNSEGVTQEPAKEASRLRFKATLPTPESWTDPGWTWQGTESIRLPTFMQALLKKKETFKPAGISLTPPDARRRWRADLWRYPPYQY